MIEIRYCLIYFGDPLLPIISMWTARLDRVQELIRHVSSNLTNLPPKTRASKAAQYVYTNLMLGKMLDPGSDPLFASIDYDDHSLRRIIGKNAYVRFCALRKRYIPKTKNEPQGEAAMILRYSCIGGLDNGLHSSVLPAFAEALPQYMECFASPINHKFKSYFSLFDEDAEYGSCGSFFKYVAQHGGTLPVGNYYMNPPWSEPFFSHLASIIFASPKQSSIIVLAPSWQDAAFVRELHAASQHFPYSIHGITHLTYVIDGLGRQIKLPTLYWVMSGEVIEEKIINLFK